MGSRVAGLLPGKAWAHRAIGFLNSQDIPFGRFAQKTIIRAGQPPIRNWSSRRPREFRGDSEGCLRPRAPLSIAPTPGNTPASQPRACLMLIDALLSPMASSGRGRRAARKADLMRITHTQQPALVRASAPVSAGPRRGNLNATLVCVLLLAATVMPRAAEAQSRADSMAVAGLIVARALQDAGLLPGG